MREEGARPLGKYADLLAKCNAKVRKVIDAAYAAYPECTAWQVKKLAEICKSGDSLSIRRFLLPRFK